MATALIENTYDEKTPIANRGKLSRYLIGAVLFVVTLAMYPLAADTTGPVKALVLACGTGLLLALVCIGIWRTGRWASGGLFRWPLVFLVCLELASALRSAYTGHGIHEVSRLCVLLGLYLACRQLLERPRHIRMVLSFFLAGAGVASCYAFAQKLRFDPLPWAYVRDVLYELAPGTYGNPNYAAHALILAVITAAYMGGKGWGRLWLGLALVFLAHWRLTEQRAGFVAFGGAAAVVLLIHLCRRLFSCPGKATAVTMLVLIYGGAVVTILGAGAAYWRTGTPFPADQSLLIRYNGYVSASRMAMERPLMGYGPGAFEIEGVRFWTPYEQRRFATAGHEMNRHVHNEYIEFAVDAGWGCAALYTLILLLGTGGGAYAALSAPDEERRRLGMYAAAFFTAYGIESCFGFNFRLPVTSALFMVVAGGLDGACFTKRDGAARAWHLRGWSLHAVALLAVLAGLGDTVRVFAAHREATKAKQAARFGKTETADRYLARAQRLVDSDWTYPAERGVLSMRRGAAGWGEAEDHFLNALTRNPYYFFALVNLAGTRMQYGFSPTPPLSLLPSREAEAAKSARKRAIEEAWKQTEYVLSLCPMLPQARELAGRIAFAQAVSAGNDDEPVKRAEQLRQAEEHLRTALEYGGAGQGELHALIGRVRLALDDARGAGEIARMAAESNPESSELWAVAFGAARAEGDYATLEHTLEATRLRIATQTGVNKESSATMARWLGQTKEAQGDFEAADRLYTEALGLAPERTDIWTAYMSFAWQTGRTAQARELLAAQCIRIRETGRMSTLFEGLDIALRGGSDGLARGVSILRASLEQYGPDELGWVARIFLDELSGIEESNETHQTYASIAVLFAASNQYSQAEALFEKATLGLSEMALAPDAAWRTLSLLQLNRREEAIGVLRRASTAIPEHIDTGMLLARLLATDGDMDGAIAEYERLLTLPELTESMRGRVQNEMASLRREADSASGG